MNNIYDHPDFFESYKKKRQNDLSYNEVIEMPEVKRAMPVIKGKAVLDIGCGMGNLIQYILDYEPARVVGIDQSQNMISECRKHFNNEQLDLHCTNFMDFKCEETFDVIVSSLVLHYIEDFNLCCQKISELLSKDGTLLFTMEHPIQTATMDPEVKKEDSDGVYLRMEHYFDETSRTSYWLDQNVKKYHHTIETIFNNLIQHGLEIQYVKDLGQSEEVFQYFDEKQINKLKQFPPFLMVKAKKQ